MIFTTTQQASELDPDFCSTPHVPPSCNKAAPWWGWSDRYCRKGEVWIAPLPYAPCFSGQNVAKSFAEHCGLLRVNERFLRPCQFSTANACLRNWLGHPSHPNPHPKKRRRGPRSSHETLARVPEELGEGISKHLQMKGFCLSQLSGLYSFFVWLVLSKRCNQPVLCFFCDFVS